jgi:hypothetical protein
MPQMSMQVSGSMMHMNLSDIEWSLTLMGFLFGLIVWSLSAGLIGWLFALFYNKLS